MVFFISPEPYQDKIVLVILHINASKEWRGGENQVLYLAQGLRKSGIPQTLFLQPGCPLAEKAKREGLDVVEFPMRSEFDWKAIRKIRETIAEKNIELVHTHTSHAHSLAFFAKKKKDNWKLIVARRVDFRVAKNWFSKWKFTSPLIDMVVGVSRCIQNYLIQDGLNPSKTLTIHSGIDPNSFKKLPSREPLIQELGLDKSTLTIGIIAALVDHKDHKTFLSAISKITTEQKFQALILGEGKLEESLKIQAKDLGIEDRVRFLGFREDVPAFLNLFDIFCLSSKEEGLGTAILDAMASGLPVVATRAGGIPEMVVPEKGGFLCGVGDSDCLAEKFRQLLESEQLRKKMGEYNRERVQDFSHEETIRKTIHLYYSFLGDKLFPVKKTIAKKKKSSKKVAKKSVKKKTNAKKSK